jgi:carboxypeptidase D
MSLEGLCDTDGINGRGNVHSVDLNRDFSSQFTLLKQYKNSTIPDIFHRRQLETIALSKWILKENFILSANLHVGSIVVSYPCDETTYHTDNTYDESPVNSLFRYLACIYASQGCQLYLKWGKVPHFAIFYPILGYSTPFHRFAPQKILYPI